MKFGKKWKIAIFSVLGAAFLLFATLVVHIAVMVHQRGPLAFATIQMARSDFQAPVDSARAQEIQKHILTLKGVKSTYCNLKDGILIYTFDNRINTAQQIYDEAIKTSGIPSVRYTVSKKDLARGCPVMNNSSFYGKLTAIISKVVN
jgi:hypothetical protein